MKKSLVSLRTLAVAALALVAALAVSVSPAAAQRATTTITEIDRTFIDRTCPFPLVERIQGKRIDTLFYDESGQAVRLQRHVILQATLTNPDTNTTVTSGRQATTGIRDLTTGELTVHGLRFITTVPGMGVVLLDAGTFVMDAAGNIVWEAGKHQLLHGDVDRFCAAMS